MRSKWCNYGKCDFILGLDDSVHGVIPIQGQTKLSLIHAISHDKKSISFGPQKKRVPNQRNIILAELLCVIYSLTVCKYSLLKPMKNKSLHNTDADLTNHNIDVIEDLKRNLSPKVLETKQNTQIFLGQTHHTWTISLMNFNHLDQMINHASKYPAIICISTKWFVTIRRLRHHSET